MRIFITGGAGFIGCNSADAFLQQGHEVVVFDNLSRVGGPANLAWLRERHGDGRFQFVQGDIRDYDALCTAIQGADVVLHLASQVAVTTSVIDPRHDFEVNALGTFNVLEAVRHHCPEAAVLYASTNKVYGSMTGLRVQEQATRYAYVDYTEGIPETYPLDFHSPYGCSKGAGDQYTIDYARIYGLKTLVFRQSCIYGPRQFGIEDQGWVAHFVIAAVKERPITIYGDGKQVRDLLHVHDLIRAYEQGIARIDELAGQAFNIGGGPKNALSVWAEFGPVLSALAKRPIPVTCREWRPGDQRVFIANIHKAAQLLDWQPTISPKEGIRQLYDWVVNNQHLF
ncbi:MAG: NAD-dependent epimerase/dehydratase family protein [Chloroflexi bacterium]|nr:MAG: NAD-dependent epimerase/dehydratase family protein [Chloroflexota bacterium]